MAELQHSDVDWQLHYCSRNPESCAFRDELVQHPQAEKVHLHHSSTGTRLELARLLADIEPGTHVYTCGPEALNEAVRSEAARLDIVADTLHFEQFAIEDKAKRCLYPGACPFRKRVCGAGRDDYFAGY